MQDAAADLRGDLRPHLALAGALSSGHWILPKDHKRETQFMQAAAERAPAGRLAQTTSSTTIYCWSSQTGGQPRSCILTLVLRSTPHQEAS